MESFDQFNLIIEDYEKDYMGLNTWEVKWLFKVSWDNKNLFGIDSEGVFSSTYECLFLSITFTR